MGSEMTILNSEKDFRNYIILNFRNISRIVIVDDYLSHTIFFYCFNKVGSIVATKEFIHNNFSYYKKLYKRLSKKINFKCVESKNQLYTIELFPEQTKKRC